MPKFVEIFLSEDLVFLVVFAEDVLVALLASMTTSNLNSVFDELAVWYDALS